MNGPAGRIGGGTAALERRPTPGADRAGPKGPSRLPGPPHPAPDGSRAPAGPLLGDGPVAAALAGLSAAAVLGLGRVFSDAGWVTPLLAAALLPHLVGWASRRRGWSAPATVAAALGSVLLVAVWFVAPETTRAGVPTGDSLRRLADLLHDGGLVLRDQAAPVPSTPDVLLLCMAACGMAAVTADALAFPLRSALGSVAPSLALFVLASTLATGGARVPVTVAFLAAAAVFLLLQDGRLRAGGRARGATPTGPGPAAGAEVGAPPGTAGVGRARVPWPTRVPPRPPGPPPRRRRVTSGIVLGAAAVVAGVVLGPLMPGAGGEPWLDYRSDRSGGTTGYTTVSPLVDIKARLLGLSDREVMTVRSDRAAYWRMVSLDSFDGETWTLDSSTRPGPAAASGSAFSTAFRQEFSVGALGGRWVPAAADPVAIEGLPGVRAVPASGTLVAARPVSDRRYVVWSQPPTSDPTPEQRAATDVVTPPGQRPYLFLPASFPSDLRLLARRIVRGSGNPWAAAERLERFFLDGSFTYDLSVVPGHGDNAIRDFLRERRGFCEQFAGTYAALARAAGLPARVAVGFAPGRRAGGVFHVTDGDAHAWPEVWFEGLGWVPFEPTPAGDEPGQPAAPRDDPASEAAPARPDATSTTTTSTTTAPASPSTAAPGGPGAGPEGSPGPAATARGLVPWLLVAALLALAGASWRPATAWRRRRRRRRSASPALSLAGAWHDALEHLAGAGVALRGSLTPFEAAAAARAAGLEATVSGAVSELAVLVTQASFSARAASGDDAARAWAAADRIRGALARRRSWRRAS